MMECTCTVSYDLTCQRRNLAFKTVSLRTEKRATFIRPCRIADLEGEIYRLQKRVAKLEAHERKNAEYEHALKIGKKYQDTGNRRVFR